MRAVVCSTLGPPEALEVQELPDPAPGPGQVLIDVQAAGVNFPDTLIIEGRYQFKPDPPFVPGGEASGVVIAVGEGVDGIAAGDRVISVGTHGHFATRLVSDARTVVPFPHEMDPVTASGFVLTYLTSHYALRDRAGLQAGETLLVLGAAGGVGLATVEIGKAMGARVIAAASSPAKLAVCAEHGADELLDYTSEDLKARLSELTDGRGVDVVYDPVGGVYSEQALRRMAWGGRFLVIGFAAGEIPRIPLNLTLLKSCSIIGVFWGAFSMREPERNRALLEELFDWYREGKVRPLVSATYPLERAAEALREITERRARGKIVLIP